ncbi:MAG: SulP family inorganic anion transporter [Saprospiraceae bacterium]|nr:SulP family inorganic anion transporter [Saprospiraceae bacterium]
MNTLYNKILKNDLPSSVVVFLVALPLCLGIALASGAPLFSGIISGIIGGIVVGSLSGSHVSVSGPAAGLTAIVLSAISTLGGFENFLLAVVIAGGIQVILGVIKAGTVADYFPNSVVEGMLAGIGVIIFLKQLPHAFGYDRDTEGDLAFIEKSGSNTFTSLIDMLDYIHPGAVILSVFSILLLILWEKVDFLRKIKLIPAALVVVVFGIVINELFKLSGGVWVIEPSHLVSLPVADSVEAFKGLIVLPDFSAIMNKEIWIVAATIAIVASLETLLCIEAGDKMDTHKRYSNPNRELLAQGTGNIVSGLLGGLPMTSVVVRTTANINSGAASRWSAILHGVFMLLCVLIIPGLLNKIPLASLAAILLLIGYKLAKPSKLFHFYQQGKYQFIPFIVTLLAVVFTDLLKGVGIGLIISIIYILRGNIKNAYYFSRESYHLGDKIIIELSQEVSFLNKATIKQTLAALPNGSTVLIDASNSQYIAHDILELIREFRDVVSVEKSINLELTGFKENYQIENTSHVRFTNDNGPENLATNKAETLLTN